MPLTSLYRRLSSYRFSDSLNGIARNLSATVVARGVSMTVTVLFTALFSRHVGVGGFGQYAYALSLTTLLGGLCGFGLDNWAIRELVHAPNDSARIIGQALFLQAILSVLCLGGLAAYFTFVHRDPTVLAVTLIVGAYTFLDVSGLLVISVFRAREVMAYEAIAVSIGNAALLAVTLAGIALHLGIRGVLALVSTSYLLKFIVIVWYAKRRCGVGSLMPEMKPAATPVRAGFPFFVSSIGSTVYANYPRLVLAVFVALPVVGLYAAAERIIALVLVVSGILDIVVYPMFARRIEHSDEAFTRVYQQVVDFTLVVGLLIGVGVASLLPEIVRVLFGNAYRDAVPIGMLLVPGIAMSTLGYVNARAMFVLHREKMMSVTVAATTAAGILTAFLLIRSYGVKGMAVTTLITSAFGYLFYFFYLRIKLGLPWITARYVTFFAMFALAFAVAYAAQGGGLAQRFLVNGAMLLFIVVLLWLTGMLDWLRVFQVRVIAEDATVGVASS
ncbi:MAG TPA: flippase [Thermoanaerobaculia bacterium]